MRRTLLLGCLLGSLMPACVADESQELVMLAAASVTDAGRALAESFEEAHPDYRILLSVGPSSMLARQIELGVPADVFLSANITWLDHLYRHGKVVLVSDLPIGNSLVVAGTSQHPELGDLADLVAAERIAIADPTHVPAGMYARTALECAGLWHVLRDRLLPALDVRAALAAMTSGAADVAIVYASDVQLAPEAGILLTWPEECAPEIRYGAALVSGAAGRLGARSLFTYVADTLHSEMWHAYGFTLRGDEAGEDTSSIPLVP